MRLIFLILVLILIFIGFWFTLSPLFTKIGSFFGKKAKNFKSKWEEKENE